jgi:hypothetical protein
MQPGLTIHNNDAADTRRSASVRDEIERYHPSGFTDRNLHVAHLPLYASRPQNTGLSGEAPSWPCLVRFNPLFGGAQFMREALLLQG